MAEPKTISIAEYEALTAKAAPVKATESTAFNDADFAEYNKLIRDRTTTPAKLTSWMKDKGYGDITNAAEVLTTARRNPNSNVRNLYYKNTPTPPQQDQGILEHISDNLSDPVGFYSDALGNVAQYLDDNVRMLATGATGGWADKLAAKLDSVTGLGPEDYSQGLEEQRQASADARQRTGFDVPVLGDVSPTEIAGGALVPLGSGAKGVKELAKVGAGYGAVAGSGYSDATDLVDLGVDAANGAAVGAVLTPAIGIGAQKIGEKISPIVSRWVDKAFNNSTSPAATVGKAVPKAAATQPKPTVKQYRGGKDGTDLSDFQEIPTDYPNLVEVQSEGNAGGTRRLEYTPEGSDTPINIYLDISPEGVGNIEVGNVANAIVGRKENINAVGVSVVRKIALELKSRYPEIKTFTGERISGANPDRVQTVAIKESPATQKATTKPVGPEAADEVVTKLTTALKSAGKARKEQDVLYSQARSERVKKAAAAQENLTGEDAVKGTFAALKGELPKAQFEPIANQFTQEEVNSLFDKIRTTPTLTVFGKASAYEGFQKLMQGSVPAPSELSHLSEVFPADFIKTALSKRSVTKKAWASVGEVWNLPKSMMSTFDLSAPFRQGIGLVHKAEFRDAFKAMGKYVTNPEAFKELETSIKLRPTYAQMERAGLSLPGVGGGPQAAEEMFQSHLAQHIVGYKHINAASERAYVGFLNKVRADTFDSLLTSFKNSGLDVEDDVLLQSLGKFVNTSTGRGDLGALEKVANELNMAFFSPRMIKSRLDMTFNPRYYKNLHPAVRKEAFKSAAAVGTYWGSMAGLAGLAGLTIETDPRSSDFMKAKDDNIRIDFSGGFGPGVVLAAKLITKEAKSVTNEEVRELKRNGDTPLDAAGKFLTNKAHPMLSTVFDYFRGKDAIGNEFDWGTEALEKVLPMGLPDMVETIQEKGAAGIPYAMLAFVGNGLQVFGDKTSGSGVGDKPAPISLEAYQKIANPVDAPAPAAPAKEADLTDSISIEEYTKLLEDNGTTHENLAAKNALEGLGLFITDDGIRSNEEQQKYYDTTKGVSKPGTGRHEVGNAIDVRIPEDVAPEDIIAELEAQGYYGVTIVTKQHGTGPHWHIQWDGKD